VSVLILVLEFIVWDVIDQIRGWFRSWRPVQGVLTAQLAIAAVAITGAFALPHGQVPAPHPRHVVSTKTAAPLIMIAMHSPPPRPTQGPRALQERLDKIAADYREPVGIAVSRVDQGWVASVAGDGFFPQQSVSKTWVALSVLEAIDRGRISLDQVVWMRPQDRSVFFQPLAEKIGTTGYATTVRELLRHALINSDNSANDRLITLLGGVEEVRKVLVAKGLASGIRLGADERDLQAAVAGMTWRPEYGFNGAFKAARLLVAKDVRDAATQHYIADPMDGASPVAIAQALAALRRGELLSPASSAFMLATMAEARTGPRRLRGGLPKGWSIAHKTGTGQDWHGGSIGINDVALITAPDGRAYAVAVMIRNTRKGTPARLAMMQEVSKAVVADWQSNKGAPTPPPAQDSFPRPVMAP
jgi:beta-lactamase class A